MIMPDIEEIKKRILRDCKESIRFSVNSIMPLPCMQSTIDSINIQFSNYSISYKVNNVEFDKKFILELYSIMDTMRHATE